MNKLIIIILVTCFYMGVSAQGIYNNGAYIVSTTGSYWVVDNGDFTLTSNSSTNPTQFDNLTIKDGASITLGSGSTPAYLTVSDGLTISSGGSMTIASGSSGTGSLIVEGTASGNVTVQRFLTHDRWHYISGQTNISGNFSTLEMGLGTPGSTTSQFYRWEENYNSGGNVGNWVDILNGEDGTGSNTLMGDEGFVAGKGYGINYVTSDKTLNLTGVPYTTNQTIALQKTPFSTGEGSNLVGNPFTSTMAINSNADGTYSFISQNAAALDDAYEAIYIWNESAEWNGSSNADYATYNNSSDALFIEPGQAFMVMAASDEATLTFSASARRHGTASFYKNGENDQTRRIYLSVSGMNDLFNSTEIVFLPGMTTGLDPSYDAAKMKGNTGIALYTSLVDDSGMDFAIQALPDQNIEDYIVSIGVDVNESAIYEFSITQAYLDGLAVVLEDRQENTFTNLRWDTYFATISESGTGRFYLHFKDATAIGEITPETNISFRYLDGEILIDNPDQEKGYISLVNVAGQVLYRFELDGNSTQEIGVNQSAGICIICILTNKTHVSRKVFIK